jgi:hypothetical protein
MIFTIFFFIFCPKVPHQKLHRVKLNSKTQRKSFFVEKNKSYEKSKFVQNFNKKNRFSEQENNTFITIVNRK